jgi:HemY protein
LRAVHAAHDPEWTADGYVSDSWRSVSPVTGRLDAFQWMVPVAALPSSNARAELERAATMIPARPALPAATSAAAEMAAGPSGAAPAPVAAETSKSEQPSVAETQVPVFRPRTGPDLRPRPATPSIPAVIPLVRAPDDPGITDAPEDDDFADRPDPATAQAGGLKGFWSRLVG